MTPVECLYFLGYSLKKRYSLAHRKRLPCGVISIGNITLGGTGKTPAVIALAKNARQRGFAPCILTRGYRGKAKGPCFVSTGEGPLMDARDAGDEAVLMAEALRGVPIVKGNDRHEAGMYAIERLELERKNAEMRNLFILDDGFQHWALYRDVDILLIDGTNPFGNGKLFPMGVLREPLSAIARADVIVISRTDGKMHRSPLEDREVPRSSGEQLERLVQTVRRYSSAPLFSARHEPVEFVTPSGRAVPLVDAERKRIFGFCGIGNPRSFRDILHRIGGEVTGFIAYRDHYRYGEAELRQISQSAMKSGAEWIVTTEKDIMRLKRFPLPDNLLALRIEFRIDGAFYDAVFEGIGHPNKYVNSP